MRLHYVLGILAVVACGEVTVTDDDDGTPDAAVTPDVTAPTILAVSPTDGAIGVHGDAVITITFSEPMDRATVEAAWTSTDLPASVVEFAWNATDDMLTVTPDRGLPLATGVGLDPSVVTARTIAFEIAASAADRAGNQLAGATRTLFATQRRLTIKLAPVLLLTRSIRADGFVFPDAESVLRIGDTIDNLQLKTFLTFTLPALPAGAALDSASLVVSQTAVAGLPYTLGEIVVRHVSIATINAGVFASAPLADGGTLSTTPALGVRSLDVAPLVAADLAAQRPNSQFRIEFPAATNANTKSDEAQLARSGMTVSVAYVID
jgi:hypothetical protein